MTLATVPRSSAKHALITSALMDQIKHGHYKVGGLLPSEPELAKLFGVSRQTVRVALRNLRELGLVTPRHGVGSTVRTSTVQARYAQSFESVADLLQYAKRSPLTIISIGEINVDSAMAEWLACRPGERWWCIEAARKPERPGSSRKPIAYSKIYIPYAFGSILKEVRRTRGPVYPLLEKHFNEMVTEIRQEITAVSLSEAESQQLRLQPGQPALAIVRRYYGKEGRTIQVSRSLHPGDSFTYSMHVRLATND
jgi:DNA-binding GntR family transcriptional regulator